jgi:hypothetical protein
MLIKSFHSAEYPRAPSDTPQGGAAVGHEISSVALVGALNGPGGMLSSNDQAIFFYTVRQIKALGIPVGQNLLDAARPGVNVLDIKAVDIINRDERHGGRDFLKESIKTDLLMFCNVAWSFSQHTDVTKDFSLNHLSPRERAFLTNSLQVSELNGRVDLWREKTRDSGANIVAVTGIDDVPPEKLVGDTFVSIKLNEAMAGFLFRRDYLRAAEPMLRTEQSGLVPVLDALKSNPSLTAFIRPNGQQGVIRPLNPAP